MYKLICYNNTTKILHKRCVDGMKYFVGASMVVMMILISTILIRTSVLEGKEAAVDDEQIGLQEQIFIRFSHVVAENTPKGRAAQKFAELVAEKTNGRVKVQVFPNGTLYSDDEEIDALVRNDVQMVARSFSKMTELVPEWQMFDIPFLFENYDDVETVFTGDVGNTLLGMLNEDGIKGLSLWSNGFKQMTSNKQPLRKPEDFNGQRFRIMPSMIIEEQFRLLGAEPIVVPFNQVYHALEKNQFEGQENTISNIYSKRLYQLQRYMTISNHGYLGYAVLVNGEFWMKLPKDIRLQVAEAMQETTHWILKESERMNEQQLAEIQENSDIEVYYLTDEERKLWKQHLQPLYEKFRREADPKLVKKVEYLGK